MIQQLVKKEVDEPLEGAEITDEEIKAIYDANPLEFSRPKEVRASDIFIKDRAGAKALLVNAKKADRSGFRKLAERLD